MLEVSLNISAVIKSRNCLYSLSRNGDNSASSSHGLQTGKCGDVCSDLIWYKAA
ncbi:predicted protein [Botrytis cinerea T4]|uniref:Uncharacterized protein n=1 Tax=Botryotinia fuckeliana (strain T4) TaxID=999810 RepID=G2Y598_BOTF4|nr:predicted protein [Botrytis cinerea T4]